MHAASDPIGVHNVASGRESARRLVPVLWKWLAFGGIGINLLFGGAIAYLLRGAPSLLIKREEVRNMRDYPIARRSRLDEAIPAPVPAPSVPRGAPRGLVRTSAAARTARSVVRSQSPSVGMEAEATVPDDTSLPTARDLPEEELAEHTVGSAAPQRPVHQEVSEQAMMQVVSEHKRELRTCYERMLKLGGDDAPKRGHIVASLRVGISGRVLEAALKESSTDPELDRCFVGVLEKWVLPASSADYNFEFPIILQAN